MHAHPVPKCLACINDFASSVGSTVELLDGKILDFPVLQYRLKISIRSQDIAGYMRVEPTPFGICPGSSTTTCWTFEY